MVHRRLSAANAFGFLPPPNSSHCPLTVHNAPCKFFFSILSTTIHRETTPPTLLSWNWVERRRRPPSPNSFHAGTYCRPLDASGGARSAKVRNHCRPQRMTSNFSNRNVASLCADLRAFASRSNPLHRQPKQSKPLSRNRFRSGECPGSRVPPSGDPPQPKPRSNFRLTHSRFSLRLSGGIRYTAFHNVSRRSPG